MTYNEFRDRIQKKLSRNSSGLTWIELRDSLNLPYDHPCPNWIGRLEIDIRLERVKGKGRALVWRIEKSN